MHELLEVEDGRWFGRLACIPELITRRHRGRSQAPWTVVMFGWAAELKHPHLKRGIDVSPTVPLPYVFSWALLLVGDTAEVVSSSATSRTVEELIRHNYRQYWCTQQIECSTHTPVL